METQLKSRQKQKWALNQRESLRLTMGYPHCLLLKKHLRKRIMEQKMRKRPMMNCQAIRFITKEQVEADRKGNREVTPQEDVQEQLEQGMSVLNLTPGVPLPTNDLEAVSVNIQRFPGGNVFSMHRGTSTTTQQRGQSEFDKHLYQDDCYSA
jgi:hypothetical protein